MKILPSDINLDGVDLIFEVTRNCNMRCPHCIRGEAQKINIKKSVITDVLEQFKTDNHYIGILTFSGGEPLLNIKAINFIISEAKRLGVSFENFWFATNGSVLRSSTRQLIETLYNSAESNEISGIRISIDQYHDDIEENEYKWKDLSEYFNEYMGSKIYFEFQGAPKPQYLINDGRAKDNYYTERFPEPSITFDGRNLYGGYLYITVDGDLISTCDVSYESMMLPEFHIGNIRDGIKNILAEYFNKYPNLVSEQ